MALESFLDFLVEGVGLGLAPQKDIIDELISHGPTGGLENEIGSILQHILHLFLRECLILLGIFLLLDDQAIPFELDHLPLHDLLLHCVLSDESIDIDHVLLADAMGSIHGLQVHLRIEVTIIDHDSVRSRQVDAEAPCSCREQEDKLL